MLGPNPIFTNSQEIQEIRVTSVTALNHQEAAGGKEAASPSLSILVPGCKAGSCEQQSKDTGLKGAPEKSAGPCSQEEACRHLGPVDVTAFTRCWVKATVSWIPDTPSSIALVTLTP